MFLPRFDVLCALSEYKRTAKCNMFVTLFRYRLSRTKLDKFFDFIAMIQSSEEYQQSSLRFKEHF